MYTDIKIYLCVYTHIYMNVYKTDSRHNDYLVNSPFKDAEGGRESNSFLLRLASCVLHCWLIHFFKATGLCQMHRVKPLMSIIISSEQNHTLCLALEAAAQALISLHIYGLAELWRKCAEPTLAFNTKLRSLAECAPEEPLWRQRDFTWGVRLCCRELCPFSCSHAQSICATTVFCKAAELNEMFWERS